LGKKEGIVPAKKNGVETIRPHMVQKKKVRKKGPSILNWVINLFQFWGPWRGGVADVYQGRRGREGVKNEKVSINFEGRGKWKER